MAIKATLAASVQKKNGRLHAVIQVKENGKTKSVWRALGLPEGASQTQVNKAFRKVVTAYEEEYNKRLARDGRPDADIPIFPFLCTYLEKANTFAPAFTTSSMIPGTSIRFVLDTVVMITLRIPARLIHPIFSNVQS